MKGRHLACNSTQTSCWVLKSTDRYFFEAVFFHYALKAPCSAPDLFPMAQSLLTVQGKGKWTDHISLVYSLSGRSNAIACADPTVCCFSPGGLSAPYDFYQDIYMSTCDVCGWKGRTQHLISSTPLLSSSCHCFPLISPASTAHSDRNPQVNNGKC